MARCTMLLFSFTFRVSLLQLNAIGSHLHDIMGEGKPRNWFYRVCCSIERPSKPKGHRKHFLTWNSGIEVRVLIHSPRGRRCTGKNHLCESINCFLGISSLSFHDFQESAKARTPGICCVFSSVTRLRDQSLDDKVQRDNTQLLSRRRVVLPGVNHLEDSRYADNLLHLLVTFAKLDLFKGHPLIASQWSFWYPLFFHLSSLAPGM